MQNVLLDLIIIASLMCAIYFCWRLNNRLHVLKDLQLDVTPAINVFNKVSDEITQKIKNLQNQLQHIRQFFGQEVPKAQTLKDDLELLLEYCEVATKNLEKTLQESKQVKKELDDILVLIAKALPKDMQENLKKSSITVDFEALRDGNLKNLFENGYDVVIPHKMEASEKIEEFYIDQTYLNGMKDLH